MPSIVLSIASISEMKISKFEEITLTEIQREKWNKMEQPRAWDNTKQPNTGVIRLSKGEKGKCGVIMY